MVSSGPLAINPSVFSRLSYDPLKDFTPISPAFVAPLVLPVLLVLLANTSRRMTAARRNSVGRYGRHP